MSHRDSEEEKLVEEIEYILWGLENSREYRVGRAITRIGKAYADGELMLTKVPPKLPGEVGRDIVETFWVDDYLNDNVSVVGDLWPMLRKGDCVIALRPLSGTGKEEE